MCVIARAKDENDTDLSYSSARPRPEWFLPLQRRGGVFRKGITVNRFIALILMAGLGVCTVGCDGSKGTTESKTQTTTTQTKDGKTTGESKFTTTDTTKTTPATNPGTGGMKVEKKTETTTETTR